MALVTSLVTQWMDTSEKQDEKVKIPMSDKILRMAGEDDDVLAQLVSNTNFFRCVMVQNIPEKFDDLALFELFMDFGDIEKIWIQERTKRNRHGRATIIFKNASDAEMAEAIMNETEVVDRTLQVHIGVPPSERRKERKKGKERMQCLDTEEEEEAEAEGEALTMIRIITTHIIMTRITMTRITMTHIIQWQCPQEDVVDMVPSFESNDNSFI
eukprot:275658_1